jgi:hypothetical protein
MLILRKDKAIGYFLPEPICGLLIFSLLYDQYLKCKFCLITSKLILYLMYRLPFTDDGKWLGAGNADDPSGYGHAPGGQFYAFDFKHKPEGAEVRAVRGGIVVFVENNQTCNTYNLPPGDPCEGKPGYGNAVLIRHLDNTVAAYNHMQKGSIPVTKNQWVAQGQKIGLSGNTGYSSEPHLHLDVRAYWNNENDFGSTFPIIFQDKNHLAWRPHVGDVLHSNNDYTLQEDWRWCKKCRGLFFGGNPGSVCPAGGAHDKTGGGNYSLVRNSPNFPGQQDWRWCKKCQGLFFGGNPGSVCPAGGAHTGGGNYNLKFSSPDPNEQVDWHWCNKCQGLFFGDNLGSICPVNSAHNSEGSGAYVLLISKFNAVQGNWYKCSKCRVLFYGGGAGSKCPKDNGPHDITGSNQYYITIDTIEYPGNSECRRCDKCKALWWAGGSPSKCPVGSGGHSKSQTGHVYYLVTYNNSTPNPTPTPDQGGWKICDGCRSLYKSSVQPKTGECLSSGGQHSHLFGSNTYCVLISNK